jgi:hypothetical protein
LNRSGQELDLLLRGKRGEVCDGEHCELSEGVNDDLLDLVGSELG